MSANHGTGAISIFDPRQNPISDDDIRSFLAMMAAPDQTQWDYEEPEDDTGLEVGAETIAAFRSNFLPNVHNFALWAKADHTIVGMVGINCYTAKYQAHAAELGVGVAVAYQRQGLGYRLIDAIINKARLLELKRLEACCMAENTAVIRLLHKTGFAEEGIRQHAILKHGQYHDERIFGLLLD